MADCGLRIADCGFLSLDPQYKIAKSGERNYRISSIRNPQSAIRNPQSQAAYLTRVQTVQYATEWNQGFSWKKLWVHQSYWGD